MLYSNVWVKMCWWWVETHKKVWIRMHDILLLINVIIIWVYELWCWVYDCCVNILIWNLWFDLAYELCVKYQVIISKWLLDVWECGISNELFVHNSMCDVHAYVSVKIVGFTTLTPSSVKHCNEIRTIWIKYAYECENYRVSWLKD